MDKFTKEQQVQSVYDLKAGYTLGHADIAILNELARIALASLEAEDAAKCPHQWSFGGLNKLQSQKQCVKCGRVELATQPAPVSLPAAMEMDDDFDSAFEHGKAVGWNAYRAAMLQGAEPVTTDYKSPDDFICMLTGRAKYLREKGEIKSPELLERAAAALQGESVNTPPIPNGWKLVPIDPTKDMLRAGQSVVGFWLNTVHCYSKMLAAAPEAPQQEVKP